MAWLLFKMDLPSSRPSSLIQGKLHVMEGSTSVRSWTATSGRKPWQSLNDQKLSNKGPIPSCRKVGIDNYSAPTKPYWGDIADSWFYHIKPEPLGPSDRVNVDGVIRGAFGFHLDANHSTSPGSAGCIVFVEPEWTSFQNFMKDYRDRGFSRISLIVEYNNPTPVPTRNVFKVNQPTPGQRIRVNTPITFSGTAEPEVSTILALVGPGGPFKIADLKNVEDTWEFSYSFLSRGTNRPFRFRAFDSSGNHLQDIEFKLTIS